jgi:hypothetical protein
VQCNLQSVLFLCLSNGISSRDRPQSILEAGFSNQFIALVDHAGFDQAAQSYFSVWNSGALGSVSGVQQKIHQ